MIEYIDTHQTAFWLTFGLLLLAIEVLVFGLTTMLLLFAGLGALVTGLLIWLGLLEQTWSMGIASFGITSGVISILLWVPLRRLQKGTPPKQSVASDFVGLELILSEDVTPDRPGRYRYSGIDWKLLPDKTGSDLHKGDRVKVTSVDVGIFRVSLIDNG